LASGADIQWYCVPPLGRSGGILVGINAESLSVQDVIVGDRCAKFYVTNKIDNFKWVIVVVYGAAQDEHKADFLAELVRLCENEPLPLLVGGDFNILWRKEDKNNDNFNPHWPFIFNAIIDSLDLRELANRRQTLTFEKLDQILVSVEWEQKFPLASIHALPRSRSDHTPLLLDTGEQAHLGNKVNFSFELSWLKIEGFKEVVIREWLSIPRVDNPMLNWQNKIRHLRQYLRGWAREWKI
jgi:hypothetical protein